MISKNEERQRREFLDEMGWKGPASFKEGAFRVGVCIVTMLIVFMIVNVVSNGWLWSYINR